MQPGNRSYEFSLCFYQSGDQSISPRDVVRLPTFPISSFRRDL